MFWIRTRREYRKLQALHDEAEEFLEGPGERLSMPVERISGWTPAQHLWHASEINTAVFDRLLRLCEEEGEVEADGRPNLAGRIILHLGRIPRGRGRSPERVQEAQAHLDAAGCTCRVARFEGGHRLDTDTLRALAAA